MKFMALGSMPATVPNAQGICDKQVQAWEQIGKLFFDEAVDARGFATKHTYYGQVQVVNLSGDVIYTLDNSPKGWMEKKS